MPRGLRLVNEKRLENGLLVPQQVSPSRYHVDRREAGETEVADRVADERTNGRLGSGDKIDDVTELREDRTEDVESAECGRAKENLDQRGTDEAEQREIELREEDGDAYPDARQSVQRREQRTF